MKNAEEIFNNCLCVSLFLLQEPTVPTNIYTQHTAVATQSSFLITSLVNSHYRGSEEPDILQASLAATGVI